MNEHCKNLPAVSLHWDMLPAIPDTTGFAGSFAGTSHGALLVAGGSNFPGGGTPWNGGKKVWYDHIYVLEKPDGAWKLAGKLPRALGYGVSVVDKEGLICIGGSNAEGHYSEVFRLRWVNGAIETDTLPSLPATLANSSGALVKQRIYVAGGLRTPVADSTVADFYMLDLQAPAGGWKALPPCPGPARMLAVAGATDDEFFLFSGAALQQGKRTYLRDAWLYHPQRGWQRRADLPQAVVAAPSPAWLEDSMLTIIGGDAGKDAAAAATLREQHPGFSTDIWSYDINHDRWMLKGKVPVRINADAPTNPNGSYWAPVTTTLACWNNMVILPGGEVRPGVRTPHVWAGSKR
ncbi:galactose oxidase [Chitinophaga sp. sic0106]|uniref:galactose oxidase n=1 Tax=Chitinophaga sp. sic0106 TaxID=2854785 RepID=UPI001C43D563|nr:galactose oxidase [Chitinophaga sp. sic0106]MBV7530544.1 galactose oxidase [Chitinophaga sp. sic0106]